MPNVIGMEHCDDQDTPPPAKKRGRKKSKLTKLLRDKDHKVYEIWNQFTAESVFFNGKPTKAEILEICKREWPPMMDFNYSTPEEYVDLWITVEPLRHFYSAA